MNPITGILGLVICAVIGFALLVATIALWHNAAVTTCMYDYSEQACKAKYSF